MHALPTVGTAAIDWSACALCEQLPHVHPCQRQAPPRRPFAVECKSGYVRPVPGSGSSAYQYIPAASLLPKGTLGVPPAPVVRRETPAERFTRLHAELQELASDLHLLGVPAPPSAPELPGAPTPSAVAEALTTLTAQAHKLGAAAVQAAGSEAGPPIPGLSQRAMAGLGAAAALPPPPHPEELGEPGADASGTLHIDTEGVKALEARLAEAERRLWGDSAQSAVPGESLEQRLAAAESAVRAVTTEDLAVARRQAQLLQEQLELMPAGSQDGTGGVSDADLDAALATLTKWEGTRAALPRLVSRLESLQALHASTAQFSARLAALEAGQGSIDAALGEGSEVMRALQESLESVSEDVRQQLQEAMEGQAE